MRAQTLAIPLVLMPGLDGTDIFFQPLLAALPDTVERIVIIYPKDGPQDYAHLLTLVRERLQDVPAYCLLGWSFSGPLAVQLAAAEPQKVRGLILAASFVRPPQRWMTPGAALLRTPLVWLWRFTRRLPLWLGRPTKDALRLAKDRTWREVSAGVLAARLRAIAAVDVRVPLQACSAPMLYLSSETDGIVPPRAMQESVRLQPAMQVARIPGYHQALYTHPEPAAQAVLAFLARLQSA
jgi:pimeloyl-ACP methyl ester carboxylesterase